MKPSLRDRSIEARDRSIEVANSAINTAVAHLNDAIKMADTIGDEEHVAHLREIAVRLSCDQKPLLLHLEWLRTNE